MDRPMGQVLRLDERVNEAGLLRLMPPESMVENISNTLRNIPGAATPSVQRNRISKKHWLLDFKPVRFALLRIYDAVFRWYYDRETR
jgi:hypothetical protein